MTLTSKGSAARGLQPGPTTESSPVLGPIQRGEPFLSLTIRIRAVFLGTECVAFRPWSGRAGTLSVSFGIEDGCKLPQLTWKGVTQHTVSPGAPEISSDWRVPEGCKYLPLSPSRVHVSFPACWPLLAYPAYQHGATDVTDQCDVLWDIHVLQSSRTITGLRVREFCLGAKR